MQTNNLSMQMLLQNQSSPDATLNENFLKIDSFIFGTAVDFTDSIPINPQNGEVYIFSSKFEKANHIGFFTSNKGWKFFEPKLGLEFFVISLKCKYSFTEEGWGISTTDKKNADWNATSGFAQILNKPTIPTLPTLATIATSGSYQDLSNKPTLFDGNYASLTNKPTIPTLPTLASVATSGSYNDLANKPTLFDGSYTSLTNKPTIPTLPTLATIATSGSYEDLSKKPALHTVATSGSYNDLMNKPYLHSVASSGNYNELMNKPYLHSVASSGSYADLTNKPAIPAIPTLSAVATSGSYNDLTNKPTLFDGNYASLTNKPAIPAVVDQNYIGDFKTSAQTANHGKWLLCNGQVVSRLTYSALFAIIGTAFGNGNGSTTFTLPDCRGRVNASIGQGVGLTNRTSGQIIGAETHTLSTDEMPSHSHGQYVTANNSGSGIRRDYSSDGACSKYPQGISTDNTGGGLPHNNMQPTIFLGNTFIYAGV